MSRLVQELLLSIEEELAMRIGPTGSSHYRGVFCGPPEEILGAVLQAAVQRGGVQIGTSGNLMNPILLPSRNSPDPIDLSTSGRCTDSHLVRVRTSEQNRFLILLPPGHPMNESMETTIQQMGISPSEARLVHRTPFYEKLLSTAIESQGVGNPQADFELAKGILRSELAVLDEESLDGAHQWGLLQQLFDWDVPNSTGHDRVLAIMGLFSCEDSQLDFKEHKKVLSSLADHLEATGIRKGFEILKERAPAELLAALEQCMLHVRNHCHSGSDFKESPASKYSPLLGGDPGKGIPGWWTELTLDTWRGLLETSSPRSKNDLAVKCTNTVIPDGSGLPCVVQSSAAFEINYVGDQEDRSVKISRRVGRRPPEEVTSLALVEGGKIAWEDESPPEHPAYLEYLFELCSVGDEESKPAKIKLISLDAYEIGIVPYCRSAAKIKLFRARKRRRVARKRATKRGRGSSSQAPEFEGALEVHGMGMHQLDLYTASGLVLSEEMIGYEVTSEKDVQVNKPINSSGDGHAVTVIETDEECKYVFEASLPGEVERKFCLRIEADDDSPIGAESEFDRLVIEHQKKISNERGGATIEPPDARCSDLQRWILSAEHSYRPLIIGPDFERAWTQPDWTEQAIVSAEAPLQDPRPSWSDLCPPDGFLDTRKKLLEHIEGAEGGGLRLLEEVNLGDLMKGLDEGGFATLVDEYISKYAAWLKEDYESAAWCDVILACKSDASGGSLNPDPYAILLSPVHPLRLAWHCQAQRVLKEALDLHAPCPAASTLDPNAFPDCMVLPVRETSGGTRPLKFLSVGSNSDYWQVLWNCDDFEDLASTGFSSLFGSWFGITVDGLASGFSGEQVKRSIDEMRRVYPAKSRLRILVESDSSGANSCNEGIESWSAGNLGPDADLWFKTGPTRVEIIDGREELSQPLESQVARMAELSAGTLSWYSSNESGGIADLAILAHLGTANPKLEKHNLNSPLGKHGLSRWRIRRQTGEGGKFIAETRVGKHIGDAVGLAKWIIEASFLLENRFGEIADAYVFAPNLPTLSRSLKSARYCAVSSSTLDPACFFGQMDNFYLWDYDLPSYSRRAGENSGYYLLAAESPTMDEAITAALQVLERGTVASRVPGLVHSLLVEIANRGMPTLKRLTTGGSAALGEVGMLVALRLLQGDFIKGIPTPGIVPVKDPERERLTLIVPVDPFAGHFDALRRSMGGRTYERPDLLVVCIQFGPGNEPVSLQLTPIEVKARSQVMSSTERKRALQQASKFGLFLKDLWRLGERHDIWGIAWRHLLCSWIDYGFRVYGQLEEFRHDPEWSTCHQNVLSAILGDNLPVAIDERGRLIVIDKSNQSDVLDEDSDRFFETLVVTHSDAHEIVTAPEESKIPLIIEQVGDWGTASAATLSSDGAGGEEDAVVPPIDATGGGDPGQEASASGAGSGQPVDTGVGSTSPALVAGSEDSGDDAPPETSGILLPGGGDKEPPGESIEPPPENVGQGVRFAVGSSIGGFAKRERYLHPSNTDLTQLNMGVIGNLGTGKTQLVKALLYNLHRCAEENRGVAPNVLIFDYKADYTGEEFLEHTGAKVVQPFDMPLNLFDTTTCTNERNPWLERHLFFSDILSKIFSGIGPKQEHRLKESIKSSYKRAEINGVAAPTIYDVFEKYAEACGDTYDAPYSIISNIVDQGIFVDTHEKAVPFNQFFKGVVVIDLKALGQDDHTKNLLVAIFLNLFYENMLRIEKKPFIGESPKLRALDSFLLVDEADNIMRYEFDVLRKILLQGREFGVGVILASQFPKHFKTSHENYAQSLRTWFIHGVPDISVKELQAMGFTQVDENLVERIKELGVHECLYRSHGVEGEFMRGHPFFEIANQ